HLTSFLLALPLVPELSRHRLAARLREHRGQVDGNDVLPALRRVPDRDRATSRARGPTSPRSDRPARTSCRAEPAKWQAPARSLAHSEERCSVYSHLRWGKRPWAAAGSSHLGG